MVGVVIRERGPAVLAIVRAVCPDNVAPHLSVTADGAVEYGPYASSGSPSWPAADPDGLGRVVGLIEPHDGTVGGRAAAASRLLGRAAELLPGHQVRERN